MPLQIDPDDIRPAAERMARSPTAATDAFYTRLFERAPGVRPLFPEDMFSQGQKLWNSIVAVVEYADDLERLRPTLRMMGARHVGYGAEPAHYDAVIDCLVDTLAAQMGRDWTPGQQRAWTEVLRQVADMMLEGAHEVAA